MRVLVALCCLPLSISQTGLKVTKRPVHYQPFFLPDYPVDFIRSAAEVRRFKRELFDCLLSCWPLNVVGTAPPQSYRLDKIQFQLDYLAGRRYGFWCPLSPLPCWLNRRELPDAHVLLEDLPRPSLVVIARVRARLRPTHPCRPGLGCRPLFHDFLDGLLEKRRRPCRPHPPSGNRVLGFWATLRQKLGLLRLGISGVRRQR